MNSVQKLKAIMCEGKLEIQTRFTVVLFDRYQIARPQNPLYGARFPTEIYTRGCHWIPRMLA
jgi:hypothetical protein